jgi:alpha/beta superfamily hydrolase
VRGWFVRKTIWIPMGDFRLEGELHLPEGAPRLPAAVLGHPHPESGGDMMNNVVQGIFDGLAQRGRPVLRFNFRGVGRSGGRSGDGEAEDMDAAVEVLAKAAAIAPGHVAVVGYSFGAVIGCACVAADPVIGAYVGVAPPLALADLKALEQCARPVYLVCGDRDATCPIASAEELIERCEGPKGLAIVPGADHFFRGDEGAVAAQVELFLAEAGRNG